jgi:dihydroneopterin aldolase
MHGRYVVSGMSFHAFHGVLEVERELGQVVSVDVAVEYDLNPDDDTPKTEPVVRDAEIYEITRNVVMETKFRSPTSLAARIAKDTIGRYARVTAATVSILRRQLFIPGNVDNVLVEVSCSREELETAKRA